MSNQAYNNLERRIRKAAAKEGYTIRRRTIPGYGVGYNIVDANNVICSGTGNYEMSLDDVAQWFNIEIPKED